VTEGLLRFRRNVFSQNGEDGILEELFHAIRVKSEVCCEFGAHNGTTYSNTRKLILEGWKGIMIEADPGLFAKLKTAFPSHCQIACINVKVDTDENHLERVLTREGLSNLASQLDLLSIDIDGLDSEILEALTLRPAVICIEVNGAHPPTASGRIPRQVAARNVGQPLAVMTQIAQKLGYTLVCYTANAIYVRRDLFDLASLRELTPTEAYREYFEALQLRDREWLFLENLGLVPPFHRFQNPALSGESLGIRPARAVWLKASSLRYRATAWLHAMRTKGA
jgi:hypothetical protein